MYSSIIILAYLLRPGNLLHPDIQDIREVPVALELRMTIEQRVPEIQALHVYLVLRTFQDIL